MTEEAPRTVDQETSIADLPIFSRQAGLDRAGEDVLWDVVIIGGGAVGAGIAVDAASRGLSTLILEAQDWSAGTSSRSTKLLHGGERCLKSLHDWGLVQEVLQERRTLLQNAPRLVRPASFILPCYRKGERELYAVGLGLHAALEGSAALGRPHLLDAAETAARLPGVRTAGLAGGVEFQSAGFDDARLNVALVLTAVRQGAVALSRMPVTAVERSGGLIQAVTARDALAGREFRIRARMVFNCAGVWADEVRRLVEPGIRRLLRCLRGTHVVLDRSFLPGEAGMFVPKTRDGGEFFCLPWHGMTLVGTRYAEQRSPDMDPQPDEEEVDSLLETASDYLARSVTREDVRATFTGLRPQLVGNDGAAGFSAGVSRRHAVICEFGNMITVAGGEWAAYRRMAEEAMLEATRRHLVEPRLCITKTLPIVEDDAFDPDGIEAAALAGPQGDAGVVAYARHCRDALGAVTAEDVLFRRLRIGQLDAASTERLLPQVSAVMEEGGSGTGREPEGAASSAAVSVMPEDAVAGTSSAAQASCQMEPGEGAAAMRTPEGPSARSDGQC